MDKKIRDLEENRKLQNKLLQKLQENVDNLEKEKRYLGEELEEKDKIIHNLKRKDFKCNGCDKYNKSMDEVVQATAKHREAVLALKNICEKQKQKIKDYEKEIDLYEKDVTENEEKIKQLEEDVDIGFNMNKRKSEELEKLSKEIINFKQTEMERNDNVKKLQKKNEISEKVIRDLQELKESLDNKVKELESKQSQPKLQKVLEEKDTKEVVSKDVYEETVTNCEMKVEFYRTREKDLEEEIHSKNQEIETLVKQLEKSKLSSSSSSLADELEREEVIKIEYEQCKKKEKGRDALKVKLEFLKRKFQGQKTDLMQSLYELRLKEETNKNAWSCRGFCGITHSKHNWKTSESERLWDKLDSMRTLVECETCDFEYKTFCQLEKHVQNEHTSTEYTLLGAFKKCYSCTLCKKTFTRQGELKKHKKSEHNSRGEKIGEVKEYSEKGGLS